MCNQQRSSQFVCSPALPFAQAHQVTLKSPDFANSVTSDQSSFEALRLPKREFIGGQFYYEPSFWSVCGPFPPALPPGRCWTAPHELCPEED
jgi:hypothetical protein